MIVVTGGAGFIGSVLAAQLNERARAMTLALVFLLLSLSAALIVVVGNDEFSNRRLHAGDDEVYVAKLRSTLREATLKAASALAFEKGEAANSNAAPDVGDVRHE